MDNEQRARELIENCAHCIGAKIGGACELCIAAALDAAERRGMEQAAQFLCKYCARGEEVGQPDAGGQYWHSNPFDWRPCDASKLHAAMKEDANG